MSSSSGIGHKLPKRVFPVPYQVDFSVESKGKRLDSTKRRLVWKFGFAHPPAVFPHLYDTRENFIGDISNDGSIMPYPSDPKRGVECRGREHEIALTWSLLTGKAHVYVDSREVYRTEPSGRDEIFNPFSASFHRGFDLPNPKFNGRHRIDVRCYARTPLGAKNMVVDGMGGKFRQYDLTVDGLSYFNFPAMFELGTDRMWDKVSRWRLMRSESDREEEEEEGHQHRDGGGGEHRPDPGPGPANGNNYGNTGRMVDEYYFDRAPRKKSSGKGRYSKSISKNEYKAMSPRSESEEERMIRIATEASRREWEKNVGTDSGERGGRSRRQEENDSSFGNGIDNGDGRDVRKSPTKKKSIPRKMASIGEDNLIDFGADEAARAVSHISISRQSDVSVLGDDDATTASFVMNTAWGSNNGGGQGQGQRRQQQQSVPSMLSMGQQLYPNSIPSPRYQDPTFPPPIYPTQQPWSSVGTVSTATPRGGAAAMMPPSDASFAVPPPPTWDDYNDAFGGASSTTNYNVNASVMGGSTVMVNPMSPMSMASVGMTSPMAQGQQQQQYWTQQAPGGQSQSVGGTGGVATGGGPAYTGMSNSKFDPLRADPFAS